jgi:cytidylate kinase
MQLICISKGNFSGGKELAEELAKNLDYPRLSREELMDAAVKDEGIRVGKLEMAMIKPRIFSERLALEKEHYLAFTTAYLCERALKRSLVYHGRTGHLLLPGISHIFRVRVVTEDEQRIQSVVSELGMERSKARKYLEDVDADWRRWVHAMYGVSWDDAGRYDVTINHEQMNTRNAASALTTMAQLPEFQMTPASKKAMGDLMLGAKSRLQLARDERTCRCSFKVGAKGGVVTVTFIPQDSSYAPLIPEVLSGVEGIREIRSTMASTNILWVEEAFDQTSDTFGEVLEIATKWHAAVELVKLGSEDEADALAKPEAAADSAVIENHVAGEYNGGIEDDVEEATYDDEGLRETLKELAKVGRSGGGHVVCGGGKGLVSAVDRRVPYSLVVLGDLFHIKGHAAAKRLTRELQGFVGDHIKAPVVTADELKTQYLFGKRDAFRLFGFMAVTILLYLAVFTNQLPILTFLAGEWSESETLARILASAIVFLFVPLVAFSYGTVTKTLLKLIKME